MIVYFLVNKTKEKYTDSSIIARMCCIATCIIEWFHWTILHLSTWSTRTPCAQLKTKSAQISHFIGFVYNTDS